MDAAGRQALEANLARTARAVEDLRRRGADAAFVFLRCEGPARRTTEQRRRAHWELLGPAVPAVYLDVADLLDPARLPCPGGAHLYEDGRQRLSLSLARALSAAFPARFAPVAMR